MLDPQLIIGAILFPIFVAYLIYVKNKYLKNDSEYLLLSFLLGCVIFIPVLVVQLSFNFLQPNDFVKYFFQAALVEEGFKFLILYRFKNLIVDNFDSIKFSTLISLGFAMVENIGYTFKGLNSGFGGFETIELRMFSAIPGHFIFGVNMGFLFGLYKQNKKYTTLFLMLSIISPIIIHGSYDYFHSAASLLILVIAFILNYSPLKSFINA